MTCKEIIPIKQFGRVVSAEEIIEIVNAPKLPRRRPEEPWYDGEEVWEMTRDTYEQDRQTLARVEAQREAAYQQRRFG